MRRLVALLVILSLAMAGSLPKDARFDQPVTNVGANMPLAALLEALAKSVGLSPILRDIPQVTVNADLDKKPFRQVWDLLINAYGDGKLDYALLDNNVIVVGPPAIVQQAQGQQAQTPPSSEPTTREFYNVRSSEPAQLAQFIQQEIPGVKVSVTPGANVLVVTGTAKQQADVSALLQRVDQPKITTTVPIVQKSFALSHAKAVELAPVLTNALQGGNPASSSGPAQGQAGGTGAATVVADARSNTIIVTGTPDQIALIDRLIPQLDRPVQQVQLQIRVQSVNSEVFRNLGVTWQTISGGNLVGSILETGLNLIFDATRSLTSLNIRATLDALEGQSLSRRLSDTNLLVEDNYGADAGDLRTTGAKGAEVKVGGLLIIPLTTATSTGTAQTSTREVDYGLLVRVRPQITNDGNVILEVYTQVGDDPTSGPVSGSVRIPQQTTLSKLRVKDGQTLVLGGLIQKTTTNSETKVPFLGDIPLLGELFKQSKRDTKDDELIVIITANIVKDQTAATR